MKDFEDFLSDLKIFKCKDCGSKCVYQKTWEHDVCSGCKIKELEKQLAEKDKEIKVLRKGEYQKCCQHCDAFEQLVAISKQGQMELAITELEKVIVKVSQERYIWTKRKSDVTKYDNYDIAAVYTKIGSEIIQQINKIKEAMYGKTNQE